MRKVILRGLIVFLLVALAAGAYVGWRAFGIYQTAYGGFQHLRYLLETGETIEGQPAEDVLSDSYLQSLFGDNPELVDRLKTVVDLGMATDANLKLGNVSAMIVTYRKDPNGGVYDTAIYAIGGFPDPKSKRLGFHSTGFFKQDLDPSLWLTGNSVMNLLGRDIIVFCETEKAEAHMALLFDLLNGGIMPLAESMATTPLFYSIVFPDPKPLAPPQLRTHLQTVIIRGEMAGDYGRSEMMLVSATPRSSARVHRAMQDMLELARITIRDKYSGWVKEMIWGTMNDNWWAVEYVDLLNTVKLAQDQMLVVVRAEYDRFQNNAILKTVERAGRDMALQKAFALAGELPWEFGFQQKLNPSGGYWSQPHRWGAEWPFGDEGIATPGSLAAAAERERIQAEAAAAAERERLEKEKQSQEATPAPATATETI